MAGFEHFDLLKSPLEGTNLIEASAGTGKTHAVTGLFLRLVLEKELSVKEILVVTFTEAATEELRDRIRATLREAALAFSAGGSGDRLLDGLVKNHADAVQAQEVLKEALRDFDQAAVFTIHGFCRAVLRENAFESGSLFDTELVTYEEDIKREVVEDFWRRHLYRATPVFANYAMNRKFTPDGLLSLVGGRVGRPYVKVIPEVDIPDTSGQESAFQSCFDEVRRAWPSVREEIEGILTSHPGLKKSVYRPAAVSGWIRSMDAWLASGRSNPELFEGFGKFTSSVLRESAKQGSAVPAHPFFDLCEDLAKKKRDLDEVLGRRLLGLKAELFRYVGEELAKRKRERNVQSFDDLLLNLHRALEGPSGQDLARAVRRKFKAALIDEFQDTDPIQYGIFRRVFEGGNSILFLIGDPKQAIYGFRGADVFAYMEASRDVKRRYTLRENWRSEPALVTAVNTIFTNPERPFVYDEIRFQPARPAPGQDRDLLVIDGKSEPPFRLLLLNADKVTDRGKPVTKTEGRELIQRAVAAEISRLLQLGRDKRALLGEMPLGERDIAVLVRRNEEARQMQKALLGLRIRSVLYSTANLFDSDEALEMERILAAMVEPKNERRLKAALATDMMGVRGEELENRPENQAVLEGWLGRFKEYHDQWRQRGFARMFRRFMWEQGVLGRLMAFPDGERRSTNILHLVEVLQQVSAERRLGMAGLLKWLSEQRDSSTPRLEEHQLRLESDENAVKLVTIHKSKGLQYPVVFCPFCWEGSRVRNTGGPFAFHDERENMRLTLDLGSETIEEHRRLAEKELLAENLRLLYVALTRARNRCYLVWGRFNEAETSALAYLFHQPGPGKAEKIVEATAERFATLDEGDVYRELKAIQDNARGTIRLSEM
ncbi:MAG: exodeoxyribonuclease V subunit beta, partial [Deltaproteobacteria bacterium]|nr:exodeoxyribonuclease V subunit beta [Deltaproteobacteria bacterium]